MKEPKRTVRQSGEVLDREHRFGKQESRPSPDSSHAWDLDSPIDMPFWPRAGSHSALLAKLQSDDQRVNLITRLQRTYGNSYVQRLLSSMAIQAKLTVNSSDDIYEQEADRVADTVSRATSSQAQRQPEEEEELQPKPASEIQRQEEEEELQMQQIEEEEELQARLQRQEEEEELMMKADQGRAVQLSESIEMRIEAARVGGEPLPDAARASLEPILGHDLSDVRAHTGTEADKLSRQLKAEAFTTGRDIFFREGAYQPESLVGKRLLAHELTHVVQQSAGHIRRKEDMPDDSEEPPKTTKDPKEITTKVLEAALATETGKKAINQLKKGSTKEGAVAVDALAAVVSGLFAANMDLPKAACALVPKVAKVELDKDIELGFQPIYKGKLTGKPKEWGGMVTLTIKRW